jgi:hypothetical protein
MRKVSDSRLGRMASLGGIAALAVALALAAVGCGDDDESAGGSGDSKEVTTVETVPNFPNGVYVAAENYIAENGESVDRCARAMNRSLEYAQDNPAEVRRIVPTYTETPPEAAQQMRLPVFDSELDRDGIELEAELTAKYGIVDEAPAYEDLVCE